MNVPSTDRNAIWPHSTRVPARYRARNISFTLVYGARNEYKVFVALNLYGDNKISGGRLATSEAARGVGCGGGGGRRAAAAQHLSSATKVPSRNKRPTRGTLLRLQRRS